MPSTEPWLTEEGVVTTMTEASVREFKMPDVGEGLTEAEILKWYVQPGDAVTDGQVVCEVETAKAAVELPIPYDGVVRELRFPEGATVDVGTAIIAVDVSGGALSQAPAPAPVPVSAAPEQEEPKTEGTGRQPVLVGYGVATSATKRRPRKGAPTADAQVTQVAQEAQAVQAAQQAQAIQTAAAQAIQAELNGRGGAAPAAAPRPLAKPPVRKLAKDLGVDLTTVTPTGPDGIITREDVQAAVTLTAPGPAAPLAEPSTAAPSVVAPAAVVPTVAAPPAAPVPASASAYAPGVSYDGTRETRVPVKGVRKATAQAMVGSAFTAPHVTEFVTVDVTRTMKLVEELKQDKEFEGLRVSPLLVIAKALLVAVKRNPDINAAWDEANQEIVLKRYVNLGIAAATPRGLLVPNIKDAHDKTLPQLAKALGELVSTAREGRTGPAAMQGGTVTITNVGVFGIDTGTPILNPGESAILAVGAIKLQPWVHKGKVKPRQVTTLALSFDHRLVDGELGSKVLADVAAVLEQPKRLITWA
jgi:2-oxoisovalerate dehydrogenase E2 component (dihydrolipoyl transacylase)